MILRFLVFVGITIFCILQIVQQMSGPGPVYLPLTYVGCIILLAIGFGPRGIFTWPLGTILLLIEGHWVVGWIPAVLVVFTLIGNKWLDKKHPTFCIVCGEPFEEGQEIVKYRGTKIHAGRCHRKVEEE